MRDLQAPCIGHKFEFQVLGYVYMAVKLLCFE